MRLRPLCQPGEPLPDITLPGKDGPVRLRDFVGQKVLVVYFYPRDQTPGCTAEACRFRDQYEDFVAAGAEVIGISADSERSHDTFREQHALPFVLLSDEEGVGRNAFGVKTGLFGLLPGRVTFIVDRQGVIRHVFESQLRVLQHVDEAMAEVRRLQGAPAP